VKTVAVDDRRSVKSDFDMVNVNLRSEATRRDDACLRTRELVDAGWLDRTLPRFRAEPGDLVSVQPPKVVAERG
jgi:hypothetical protein